MDWEKLYIGAAIATLADGEDNYGLIPDGAVATAGDRIAWVGAASEIPTDHGAETINLQGGVLMPGLIDCHTHLVFGGDRSGEIEARLNGATYEEIAKAGGGIHSTVKATREASLDDLIETARPRLAALMEEGVTTVEIKSGYGLNYEDERKMLRAARALGESEGVDVKTAFLGAHAIPQEFEGESGAYITHLITNVLPALQEEGLVDAVDAFCENIAFTRSEVERLFEAARAMHLPLKIHAEQLSDQGGAAMAAEMGALSADHLEHLHHKGIKALAEAGTVAVLLPGAFYMLREIKHPPIHRLRKAGVPLALATDLNPGSSPVASLLAILNMACTLFLMTPQEAVAGVTRNAARALGVGADRGTLEPGKRADLTHWAIKSPTELCYWLGLNKPEMVVKDGKKVR